MRTANRIKSESLYALLHNNWSVLFEITPNRLLNNNLSPLRSERENRSPL